VLISNSTLLQNQFNTARARGSHKLSRRSEEDEDLLDVTFNVLDLLTDDVEADGLGEGSALTDGNDITSADAESGGAVSGDGLMALLESVVLLDVVEVVTTDDDGVLHLVGDNHTLEDSATDRHIGGEWALLVNEGTLNGGLGSLEAEANFFVESNTSGALFGEHFFGIKELTFLLLESSLSLNICHL